MKQPLLILPLVSLIDHSLGKGGWIGTRLGGVTSTPFLATPSCHMVLQITARPPREPLG